MRIGASAAAIVGAAGCAAPNLGIPSSQQMAEPLAQQYIVDADDRETWRALEETAEREQTCGVLARSAATRLISWCRNVEDWQDLGTDSVGIDLKQVMLGADPETYRDLAVATGQGVSVTTAWVEDLGSSASRLHIRAVYYGAESMAGVGHSRGDYERLVVEQLFARETRIDETR